MERDIGQTVSSMRGWAKREAALVMRECPAQELCTNRASLNAAVEALRECRLRVRDLELMLALTDGAEQEKEQK